MARVKQAITELIGSYPELATDEELLLDILEGETDLELLASRIVFERQDAEAMIVGIKSHEADLSARRDRYEAKSEAMKSLLHDLMDAAGVGKLTLPEATVSITAPRQIVVIDDLDAVPSQLSKTVKRPDKKAIGEALAAGEDVPGARLVTSLPGLTVRTK
jgi:hypothetical protein